MRIPLSLLLLWLTINSLAQDHFTYEVLLEEVQVQGLPGLHSYAFAQASGKWLIVGGRRDGLHARQPNASFPQAQNNNLLTVIDVNAKAFWTAPLSTLPAGIREQLQSTNMNFYQDEDTLYIIGGYAYSATASDHITFPNLTSIQVTPLIDAIIQGLPITPYFKQITDNVFAVTGGQLGKIGHTYYLVGGHRFDGRYNPMGHATYVQAYTHQIRKFSLSNTGSQLTFADYTTVTDPIHLRRRDYNLIPQVFPNGSEGYTISSGVFQLTADLPFLYPVDITETAHIPITSFNQYLAHYHCGRASLYDSLHHEMHTLFFGGMSQFYYQQDVLIEDIQVPFVKTISRLTRLPNGSLHEYKLPVEMPGYQGAGAEFIPNKSLPHYSSEIVKLSLIHADTVMIGHLYGGVISPSQNPFSMNQTNTTAADPSIFAVWLIRKSTAGVMALAGQNPWDVHLFPNPVREEVHVSMSMDQWKKVDYFVTNTLGQIVQRGQARRADVMGHHFVIRLEATILPQPLTLTFVIDDRHYLSKQVLKQ